MPMGKTLAEIKDKWVTVTPQRQAQYVAGVTTPQKDWHDETVAAEARWLAAMQDPKVQARHAANVAATTTADWKAKTLAKSARWGQGVAGAGDAYADGFKPYRDGYDPAALPAKASKRDFAGMMARIQGNIEQFTTIKDALVQ